MPTITLRGGQQVNVTPDNANQVADQAVAAQHAADRANNASSDPGLDVGIRKAVYNAANGTGGSVSGVDVPDETPVDYFEVVSETFTNSAKQIATTAKEIAPTLPTLDKLTTTVQIALVVGGLGIVAYFVYTFKR